MGIRDRIPDDVFELFRDQFLSVNTMIRSLNDPRDKGDIDAAIAKLAEKTDVQQEEEPLDEPEPAPGFFSAISSALGMTAAPEPKNMENLINYVENLGKT